MTIYGTGGGLSSPKTGLGAKILAWMKDVAAWFSTTLVGKFLTALGTGALSAFIELPEHTVRRVLDGLSSTPTPAADMFTTVLAMLSGQDVSQSQEKSHRMMNDIRNDPRKFMQNVAASIADYPPQDFYADRLGEVILSILLTPVNQLLDSKTGDPEVTLKRVVGQVAAFILAVHTIGVIAEILALGQLQSVAMALEKMVDGIDMQGWVRQMTNPVLSRGFSAFGARYYNKRYRPERWSVSELMQLYALREISPAELKLAMQELGYRDTDIMTAVKLGERRITSSDVLAALAINMIDIQTAAKYLHSLGYGTEAIQFTLTLAKQKERQDDQNSLSSIALSAFKKNLLSEAEFRTIRMNGGVPPERIDLEIRMAQLSGETERRDLSAGNIKSAYKSGVLSQQEADHYLTVLNLDTAARQVLISTWNEELKPQAVKLNASTILSAYKAGVIDYNTANEKLKGVGWTVQDASLILATATEQMKQIRRPLSEYAIITAMNNDIISEAEALKRLVELGYSDDDAKLRLRLNTIKPPAPQRTLTKTEIVNLYEKGFYTFSDAVNGLIDNGYDEGTAELTVIANASNIKTIDDLKG